MARSGPPVEPGRWRPQHGMRAYRRSAGASWMSAAGGARTAAGPGGWSYTMSSLSRTAATIRPTTCGRFAGRATSQRTGAALGRTAAHGVPR